MSQTAIKIQMHKKFRCLLEPHTYKIMRGGRGGLKCLALGTRVIMADGSLRAVEDVIVGEQVMGPDSLPRTVLDTTHGTGPLYRVTQTSGITYVVNEAHILSLKKSGSAKRELRIMPSGNPRSPRGRYPDWPDICHIGVTVAAQQSQRWLANFRGYRAGLIRFDKRAVTIDPYFLGVWLGDGTSRELRITSMDRPIIDACRDYAKELGGDISINVKAGTPARDIGLLLGTGRSGNRLWQRFKAYGLKNNKHIPLDYLANSEEVRLALLAGLVDTDGHLHHQGYAIAQVNERLARDIKYLADTLGFRTNLSRYRTVCTNNGVRGWAWRIGINGDTWRIPCKIPYKRVAQQSVRKNKDFLLSQIQIERVPDGAWAGFTLDGDHLFLLEDGTVTHNSWSCARALLILASEKRLRILCTREVQKSIKDSVHKLLQDQIEELGLTHLYDVTQNEITGVNGSLFLFQGLAQHTVKSIKSFEKIDIVWVEEAETVSGFSWDILIPTIVRTPGSEIWVSFNPELDTDETYVRFAVNPPPGSVCIESTYLDNPWMSKEMDDARLHDLATKPKDDYEHVWLGKCRAALPGAIYASEVIRMVAEGRLCHLPYDPRLKVHTVWDMGYNTDNMSVGLFQRSRSELRVIGYLEERYKTVDWFVGELQLLRYNWGFDFLPWDGWVEGRQTGKSDAQLVRAFGRRVKPIPNVENAEDSRIKSLRQLFPQIVADKTKCAKLIECWKRYRRNVPKHGEPSTPVHDQYCLGPDTRIRTLSGWKRIADLAGTTFHLWSYSVREHRLVPARAVKCWKTKTVDKAVRVTLDNGSAILCTPDHRFMLRDETWKQAGELVAGESLMPFYERSFGGHVQVHLNDGSIADEHRYVYSRLIGHLKDGYHVHHKDEKKWNNEPLNLDQITVWQHRSIHSSTPEHKAHLRRISNRTAHPRSGQILTEVNKKRAGDHHHTRQPEYWTDDRRKRVGENNQAFRKSIEHDKACRGCQSIFLGTYKRDFCCANCKARALRARKGEPEGPWRVNGLHCADCRIVVANNHRVVSVEDVMGSTDVFDIEVEDCHNFVAEGVVVHNSHGCDMSGYASLVFDQMTNEDDGARYSTARPPQPTGTMGRLGAR